MKHAFTVVVFCWVLATLATAGVAPAAPCIGYPAGLMCEEFEYDDGSGGNDQDTFLAVWPLSSDPACRFAESNEVDNDPTRLTDGLHSCMGQQEKLTTIGSGHNRRNLIPLIQTHDPLANAINGTDENPLTLSFALDLNTSGKQWELTRYIELVLDTDKAPTDHDLYLCSKGKVWPKFPERVPYPGNGVRASLAVGAVAYLDEDPCFPENYQRPNAYQLAVFNGLAWYRLKGGVFGPDEFDLEERWHYIQVTVKTQSFHVWMRAKDRQVDPPVWMEYNVDIPRQYAGPFNGIAIGNGGCLDAIWVSWIDSLALDGGEFVTVGTGACCLPGESCQDGVSEIACVNSGGQYGGDGTSCAEIDCQTPPGACCQRDGICADGLDQSACAAIGGTFHGAFTACADPGLPPCCPDPWADPDHDGDVDQLDFAALQRCYTGSAAEPAPGCVCFDQNSDNRIDEADLQAFIACAAGPEVPHTCP